MLNWPATPGQLLNPVFVGRPGCVCVYTYSAKSPVVHWRGRITVLATFLIGRGV